MAQRSQRDDDGDKEIRKANGNKRNVFPQDDAPTSEQKGPLVINTTQQGLNLVATVATRATRQLETVQQGPARTDRLYGEGVCCASGSSAHRREDTGAVLIVLGGKASCRRKFVITVRLQDGEGRLVPADLPITASVAFAHDRSPVRAPAPVDVDAAGEPPLFTTFNGVEFPARDNPTPMLAGRATFKLALSLLSSKYENRLFCICFTPQTDPPLCPPCFSPPIRSISRKRASSVCTPPLHLFDAGFALHLPRASATAAPIAGANAPHSPDHSSTDAHQTSRGRRTSAPTVSSNPRERNGSAVDLHGDSTDENTAYLPDGNDDGCGRVISNHRPAPAEAPLDHPNSRSAKWHSSPHNFIAHSAALSPADICRLNTPSPVDSGSPNSATPTSESCIDNISSSKDSQQLLSCCAVLDGNGCALPPQVLPTGRPGSAPSPSVGCARPLRPQATIGRCRFPFGSRLSSLGDRSGDRFRGAVQLESSTDIAANEPQQRGPSSWFDDTTLHQNCSFLLGAMQRLSAAAALATPVQQKLDALMRSFLLSHHETNAARRNLQRERMHGTNPLSEESAMQGGSISCHEELEEEERAIRYLELSLYEVTMEIQRRKEDIRIKKRRLRLEDAPSLAYCLPFHQKASWWA
ncbi:hypothetical protein KP509_33G067100 [Ceratopteris richardii]|uniref:Uncharacterized protein n=1 Tax=Ceratopteris richardii TaxID=49495 RepID=A0A8T2QSI7_CERRI|nr:hypothetical protein KP509_33G067100 [Ceratopteris richardii]